MSDSTTHECIRTASHLPHRWTDRNNMAWNCPGRTSKLERLLEAQHTGEVVNYETTPLTPKTPPIESYPPFRLHGEDTLAGVITKSMEARDLGVVWDVVRNELIRWINGHYVRVEEYDRVNSGKPALGAHQRPMRPESEF